MNCHWSPVHFVGTQFIASEDVRPLAVVSILNGRHLWRPVFATAYGRVEYGAVALRPHRVGRSKRRPYDYIAKYDGRHPHEIKKGRAESPPQLCIMHYALCIISSAPSSVSWCSHQQSCDRSIHRYQQTYLRSHHHSKPHCICQLHAHHLPNSSRVAP